jgi:ribosomal-protein-alanine N-acetyltransferase
VTAAIRMRTVAGNGVVLEPQLAAHAPEMFALLADPAIYEYENAPPESEAWLAQRFARLESRGSPDGRETWLNWIVRLPDGEAAGYVQATIDPEGSASIAYIFASRFWGRGLARRAVEAMIGELRDRHGANVLVATLKTVNQRSLRLVQRLGFTKAADQSGLEADEIRMRRPIQVA